MAGNGGFKAEPPSFAGAGRISMRSYFSSHLLWTARHTSELAGRIESAHAGRSTFDIEHRGFVLSSILSAEAFLEAVVNEFLQDAADGHGLSGKGYLAPLNSHTHRLMADLWQTTDEGKGLGTLQKYELLLAFADAPRLDRGAQPYQGARLVIRLRNAIAHYQPEDLAAEDPHPLKADLRRKFADNALAAGSHNSWWPDYALGYGCADWAHRAVNALADHVCDELAVVPNYRRMEAAGWWERMPGSSAPAPE